MPAARRQLLARFWDSLCAQAWEELCRQQVPRLSGETSLGGHGPWGPASRWWHGAQPEWDLVSGSIDGRRVLLGEVKWSARPFSRRALEPALRELAAKPAPPLPARWTGAQLVRALFVPEVTNKPDIAAPELKGALVITAADLLEG